MPDVDPNLLFNEDRTYIEVVLDHMSRNAALPSLNVDYIRVDRKDLERMFVTYCSRIRQQTKVDTTNEIYQLWNKQPPAEQQPTQGDS
jgi:hypothetical protein